MRTLELPDEVVEQIERAAAARGVSIVEYLGHMGDGEAAAQRKATGYRAKFPIFESQAPGALNITKELIDRVEFEDDLRRSGLLWLRVMGNLPDVNVLFAAFHPGHPQWRVAHDWLERSSMIGEVRICRVVQMGALRLLTMPSVMKEDVRTPSEFWEGWKEVMRDERFTFIEEPPGLEEEWIALCGRLPRGASGNTDTYLAAFARAAGLKLVTFDGGFARFPGLDFETLPTG